MHLEGLQGTVGCLSRSLSALSVSGPQGFSDTCSCASSLGRRLLFEETPDSAQYGGVHRRHHTARLRVLLAGMINAKQSWRASRHFSLRAMRKLVERT